jgi:glycosyltransferase involved in cell wall biosynthesis
LFAIDAQISPLAPGGTETHVALQLDALARHSDAEFLVLGLKGRSQELAPLLGRHMQLAEYPSPYTWFKPGIRDRFAPGKGWAMARRVAGPATGLVDAAIRRALRERTDAPWLSAAENDRFLRSRGAVLVHFPYPQYFETRLPCVYEPWGLPHRHFPDMFKPAEPEWMEALFRRGCEGARIVVTATRWIKRDLIRCYGLSPSKIAVLPRIPVFERPPESAGASDAVGELPARFALFPSVTWPHKNHLGLLRGLARLRDEHGLRLDLICTGKTKTPNYPGIKTAVTELGLSDQVRFLGPIPRAQLDRLYAAASFLVHPSKFEGLGLPLVEAMHAGLPIVASNAACIPEVLGDAAILFDPDDPGAIAAALKEAIETPRLLEDLRRRGHQRLKAHFPDHAGLAARFLAIYQRAAGLPETEQERALLKEMFD